MNPVEDSAPEMLDLRQVPLMEQVASTDGLDSLDSDDDADSVAAGSNEGPIAAAPVAASPDEAVAPVPAGHTTAAAEAPRSTKRRTRGMSFLPVRQSTTAMQQPRTSPRAGMSPPATPSPLRPLAYSQSGSSSRRDSIESNGQSAVHRPQPTTPTTGSDTNSGLLAAYMNQLAAKEARVVDLRNTISRLQQEMKDAETDLAAYKDNGKKLAALVNSQDGHSLAVKGSPGDQKDVLGMGRRVVDEIGTQFWSFLEDVKSATMGNAEFPAEGHAGRPNQQNYSPVAAARPPSPHRQISPKRSIQDFLKNRPRSPIRRVRSPMNAQERQQVADQHASQRLRESERLSKKLSHLDLRAPSPTTTAQFP